MKKVFFAILVCGFWGISTVSAQHDDKKKETVVVQQGTVDGAPAVITTTFKKNHKDIKDVKWKKIGNEYEVIYVVNQQPTYEVYDASGNLIRTEVQVADTDLPQGVTVYRKNNNITYVYKEPRRIQASGVTTYRVDTDDEIVYFDADGNFIKAVKK